MDFWFRIYELEGKGSQMLREKENSRRSREAHFFENVVISEKNSTFAETSLTIKGLNTILNYNAKNN